MTRICSIENCDNPKKGLGFCNMHYQRFRRFGCPHTVKSTPHGEAMAFFKSSLLIETDDCIEWIYGKGTEGYGALRVNGKDEKVHRLALLHHIGPPPTSKHYACHKPIVCHNPSCFNYRHLSWKTSKGNSADKLIDGTHHRGEQSVRAKLTASQALAIRKDARPNSIIANEYRVSARTVRAVKHREAWAWLD